MAEHEENQSTTVWEHTAAFSRTAGMVLAVVVAALAIGGAIWIHNVQSDNKANVGQVAGLQQTVANQQQTIQALQTSLNASNQQVASLLDTTTSVQTSVKHAASQLAAAQRQASTLAKREQQAETELNSVKQDTGAQLTTLNTQLGSVQTDVGTAQTNIKATQDDLAATKSSLNSAIGDLGRQSGLIATTQTELDQLKALNERNYYDFTLAKTKKPQRVGPFLVQVKNVDARHNRYTVNVVADDKTFEKKDKDLDEPVQFLTGSGSTRSQALNELVVFKMDKNSITGYIETPKTTAAGSPSASAAATPAGDAGHR